MKNSMPTVKYYKPEEIGWTRDEVAEIEIADGEKTVFLSVMPPEVDNFWGYSITDISMIDMISGATDENIADHILEQFGCVKETEACRYKDAFSYLIDEAANYYGETPNYSEDDVEEEAEDMD